MTLLLFAFSAVALAFERVTYAYIWRHPATVRAWVAHPAVRPVGGPVEVVRVLFVAFKVIQAVVFAAWILWHSHGSLRLAEDPFVLVPGLTAVFVGQLLNAGVFVRLGVPGVFYGNRFGVPVPWITGFPFSLVPHPQYVGAVLTIWGLFFVTRFPHQDWWMLPALETVYYVAGSYAESDGA